jgi:hypothetical protein
MSSARNNISTLRIRSQAPRNSSGVKKVWTGFNWVEKNKALHEAKMKASECEREYRLLENEHDRIFSDIEFYRSIYAMNNVLDPLYKQLSDVEYHLDRAEKKAIDSIMIYTNIRNTVPTPITRKARKSKTRR